MVAMEKADSAAPAEQRVATIPIHEWIIGEGLRGVRDPAEIFMLTD